MKPQQTEATINSLIELIDKLATIAKSQEGRIQRLEDTIALLPLRAVSNGKR